MLPSSWRFRFLTSFPISAGLPPIGTLLLAVVISCASPLAHATPAVPLHTAGPYIVDSNGFRVRLNAVNWYGAEGSDYVVMGLQAQTISEIASEIKSRGFNAVRLP